MLLKCAMDFNIDLKQSWMIGDSQSDIEAGKAAGCQTVFIGMNDKEMSFLNLLEAVTAICRG